MANIMDLPQEVLVIVASYLTTPELGPLRRSCKHIERELFKTFSKEFFTKRQFMLEHVSLEALLGIANHPGLAAQLSEVLICNQAFAKDAFMRSDQYLDQKERFNASYLPRDTLLQTGQAKDMLTEVFSKLPNLRTVGLRDYDGAGRDRDGNGARWRSWGWSYTSPHPHSLISVPPEPIFPLILSALGSANCNPPDFEVILRRRPYLTPQSFHLPNGAPGAGILSVLRNLKNLFLVAEIDHQDMTLHGGAPSATYNDENIYQAPLRRFLHDTPNLESLRLNFAPEQFFAPHFLEWLARRPLGISSTPALSIPLPPVDLAHLTSLDLGMCNSPGPVLLRVLTRFNLKSFSLWKMTLQILGPSNISKDGWAEFLQQLSSSLPVASQVRSMMIGHVGQDNFQVNTYYGGMPAAVRFVPEGTSDEDKAKAKKEHVIKFEAQYTAKTPQAWLQDLSERTFITGVHSTPPQNLVAADSDDDGSEVIDLDEDEEDEEDVDEDDE